MNTYIKAFLLVLLVVATAISTYQFMVLIQSSWNWDLQGSWARKITVGGPIVVVLVSVILFYFTECDPPLPK